MTKLSINEWSEDDRPREKLAKLGPRALSDAELLAILIGSGSAKESAVDLMRRVMGDCNNNLNTLGRMPIAALEKYHGMGPAKAISILAACELGRRRSLADVEVRPIIDSAKSVYDYMYPKLQDFDVEEFHLLLLNQGMKLIKEMTIGHGGYTDVSVDIRVIMKNALLNNATVIAVCHNHPSGRVVPSRQDDKVTETIGKACQLFRLQFLDHIIIGDGKYYSYHDEGRL
ncbi:MAG: DNA repair protein RadC [Prevotella sp.]|nr:DNA repair protein RadC [Prevotella sp.]MDD4532934.1 DNA repair protein RadC [Prevotella sp.]